MRVDTNAAPAIQLFSTLWPEPPQGGRLGVGSVKWQHWFDLTPDGIAAASEHAERMGMDVYFPVCAHDRTEGCRTSSSATFAPALWVDLDFEKSTGDGYPTPEQARKALGALGFTASVAVHSGRGLHLYWLLNEPMPAEEASKLCWRWQEYFRRTLPLYCRLDSTADAARVLRVPGTINGNTDTTVQVVHNSGHRYDADEIAGLLDELGIERKQQSPASGELREAYYGLPIPLDDPRITGAISRTGPDHVGTGNRDTFDFVRELKGIPQLAELPPSASLPYMRLWYEQHCPMLEGVTLAKIEADFPTQWNLARFDGRGLQRSMQRALNAPQPIVQRLADDHGFRTDRLTRTLALCVEMGEDAETFFLSSYKLAGWLDCPQSMAYGYLGKLMRLGLIELVEKGTCGTVGKRKANVYRLTLPQLT